jgi:hypothetical protein
VSRFSLCADVFALIRSIARSGLTRASPSVRVGCPARWRTKERALYWREIYKAFDSLLLTKNKEKRRERKNGLRHVRHISDDVSSFVCDEASRASSAETTTTAADHPAHTYIRPPSVHPSIHLPARPNNQTEQTSFIYTLHDTPSPPHLQKKKKKKKTRKEIV